MHLRPSLAVLAALAVVGAGIPAHANLLDDLKNQAGSYTMPAIGTDTLGNAAGVLQYCVKSKSLNLKGLSSKVKEKACDHVLKNASSLV